MTIESCKEENTSKPAKRKPDGNRNGNLNGNRNRNLSSWLSYYENLHDVGIDLGLERVGEVWNRLCERFAIGTIATQKVITVSGTNGKGSACQMLSMLLAGLDDRYTVGTYTSPHIHRFNERITINHIPVDDAEIIEAFAAIEEARQEITLSYFEATTLAGLLIFALRKVDFAILEVGLGGRLDAINIIDADAALITSVGFDHEAFLGNDIEKIAIEKVGICRQNHPAVYAQSNVYSSVISFARQHGIPLRANGRDYSIDDVDGVHYVRYSGNVLKIPENITDLGYHQVSNCAGVLVLLSTLDLLPVSPHSYCDILKTFAVSGRLEKISSLPDVFVDVAHNEDAARALAHYIHRHKNPDNQQRCFAVLGMLRDKDHYSVLTALQGCFDEVFLGTTNGERGFSDVELTIFAQHALVCPVHACGSLSDALARAREKASQDDVIYAFGSFLVVEELSQNV